MSVMTAIIANSNLATTLRLMASMANVPRANSIAASATAAMSVSQSGMALASPSASR